MKKIIISIILIFSFFSVKIDAKENEYINGAKSGILIEETTGTILYEKNINDRLSPASMTKIMTLLLVFEAIDNKLIDFNTILTTSEFAASMGGTQVYLKVGEKITVDEAIKCVSIASANDCAVLLAEEVSGSEKEFVKSMNKKSKDLGCNNTNFTDCTGLNEIDHYTTSYDLAIISRNLITNYPKVLEYTNLKEDYIRKNTSNPFWLVNTNKLVGRIDEIFGLKTGHTSFAGYCITLYMKCENISLISVVFGYDLASKRNMESLELLRYGKNNYKMDIIIPKDTILKEFNHILYKEPITLKTEKDIINLTKKNNKNSYTYDYEYNIKNNIGKLTIKNNDNAIIEKDICSNNIVKKSFIELVSSIFVSLIG